MEDYLSRYPLYFIAEWRPEWCMDSKRDYTVDWHLGG